MPSSPDDLRTFVVAAVRAGLPVSDDAAHARQADRLLLPSPRGMRPADCLEVYREQFWLRHLHNLAEDYPTLAWVVGGRETFDHLARQYIGAFPPRTWDLQKLGADMPTFVAGHPLWGGDSLAVDAARIDWAFMEAFDAPDASPFDPRVLATTPEDAWPGARIALHPSLRLVALAHPVHELRDAVKGEDARERPPAKPAHIAVWRDAACWLHSAAIDPIAFELLAKLSDGAPLGEACESAASGAPDGRDVSNELGGWFQQWTASGWISAVSFA